jgi:hypothetical protein
MTTQIDWSTLSHAYGVADDIPTLLASLRWAPAPHDARDEPWFSLWSALCHQGDVYTASYAAVPELVTIAEARVDEPQAALECLYLAAMIELDRATSYSRTPPPGIPAPLHGVYGEALRRGATLIGQLPPAAIEPDWRKALTASALTFRGAHTEARALVDPPEEEEGASSVTPDAL